MGFFEWLFKKEKPKTLWGWERSCRVCGSTERIPPSTEREIEAFRENFKKQHNRCIQELTGP